MKGHFCPLAVVLLSGHAYNRDVRGPRLFSPAEPAVDPIWHSGCEAQHILKMSCWDIISGAVTALSVVCEICTCLEPPELAADLVCCSFSNSSLFLDTSSNSSRVLWVTSGYRTISDFSKRKIKSKLAREWQKEKTKWCWNNCFADLCCLSQPLHLLLNGPGWNPLPGTGNTVLTGVYTYFDWSICI